MVTILTTVDGSAQSQAILPVVTKFALAMNAKVRLLTVVPLAGGTSTGPQYTSQVNSFGTGPGVAPFPVDVGQGAEPDWAESKDQAINRAVAEARDSLSRIAKPLQNAGIEVDLVVVMDSDAANAIIRDARQNAVDLIALATHGRSGLNQLVQGSVASAVVRSGVGPTLLVRPQA